MSAQKRKLPEPIVSRDQERRALSDAIHDASNPQRRGKFYVSCTLGLEKVLEREVRDLGISEVRPGRGGVEFEGSAHDGQRANLWLRTAIRVQEEVGRGEIRKSSDLYDLARTVRWDRSINEHGTIAVHASIRDSVFNDGQYAGLVVKDAVVDGFRDRTGIRPSVDKQEPQLPIKAVVRGREAILYRDWSGASLHKRGYRPIQVKSPLNEAIAAGLLLSTDWDRRQPLLDPMCGSGTFCIEAAFIAGNRAPGLGRRFAFEAWNDHDAEGWEAVWEDAAQQWEAGQNDLPPIQGADHHEGALSIAEQAARSAELHRHIRFEHAEIRNLDPDPTPGLIVVNPPYGERLGSGDELTAAWFDLGTFLREKCSGATAWVLSGDPSLTRDLRLRAENRMPVANGPIDCRWVEYRVR